MVEFTLFRAHVLADAYRRDAEMPLAIDSTFSRTDAMTIIVLLSTQERFVA